MFKTFEKSNFEDIKAKSLGATKTYDWIIRPASKPSLDADPRDKDTYISSDLGAKIATFVAGKDLRKPLSLPITNVIYADSKYAIFENSSSYKQVPASAVNEGLSLEDSKVVLRALARLHAASFAYFNQGGEDVKALSEALKMIVFKHFQTAATAEDKNEAKEKLEQAFESALAVARY